MIPLTNKQGEMISSGVYIINMHISFVISPVGKCQQCTPGCREKCFIRWSYLDGCSSLYCAIWMCSKWDIVGHFKEMSLHLLGSVHTRISVFIWSVLSVIMSLVQYLYLYMFKKEQKSQVFRKLQVLAFNLHKCWRFWFYSKMLLWKRMKLISGRQLITVVVFPPCQIITDLQSRIW